MALRIYRAPNGRTYQYEEGEQPEGYVPADAAPKAAPKTANKSRRAPNKKASAEKKD